MRIHPLVPFALAVASVAVPACADSAPLRANRRLQEEEIVEAKKDDTSAPKVITSNAQLDGNMKGGKLNEVKVVGLVLQPDEQAEIFSTGLYTLVADCKDVKQGKERIVADIRLYIKHPLKGKDLEYLAGNQLVVSQIAREVNYMPRFSLLNATSTVNLHSIPLVSAAVRDQNSYTNGNNVGYQLYNEPGDSFDDTNDLPAFGFWGNNPGLLFQQDSMVAPPIKVAMPFDSSDIGTQGAITGTGDFGRIQTSEGFSVEFTTANGNGVFAANGLDSLGESVPRDICFFSGDVTYTDMGGSKSSKSRRE